MLRCERRVLSEKQACPSCGGPVRSRIGLPACEGGVSMKLAGITCVLLAVAPLSFGANKETIELQRDVAQLQEQVRALQKTLDQLTVVAQQALEVGNRS